MIISKVLNGLLKGLLFLSSFAGFGIVAVVLLSVFQRYVLKSPLSFSEELVGLLLSSMLFMSLPYISNTEKHVKITLISNLLQIKYKIWLTITDYLINLIFSVWMLIETIEWMDPMTATTRNATGHIFKNWTKDLKNVSFPSFSKFHNAGFFVQRSKI